MNTLIKFSIYLTCALGMLSLNGCSSLNIWKNKKPAETQHSATANADKLQEAKQSLAVQLNADQNVNPNENGQASPLVIRIYQLKDNANFSLLDFFSLYQQPATSLNADLISQQQVIILPGQEKDLSLTLEANTHYLGVLAAYRKLDQSTWRASIKVAKTAPQTLTIHLGRSAVRLQGE